MNRTRTIRLIEPRGREGRPFNAWIARWPLLGPITLASLLESRGFDVAVYNENVSGPLTDNPPAWDDICSADVVGISIMTPTASRGYDLAGRIRRSGSGATIVFGGVHASFLPHEAIRHGDLVVSGEGESVIERIASGEITEGIIQPEPPQDLDAIPPLNYRLMYDFDRLTEADGGQKHYRLPVMASRGCPHGCTYCSVTRMFGRKVRRQSVEKVVSDIRFHRERGFGKFFFYDDNFTANRRWSRDLLDRLQHLDIQFNAQVRVDFAWKDRRRTQIDSQLLSGMARAGADVLYIGYETIEEATAEHWKKGYRGQGSLRDRLMEDTGILHDHGCWIHGMFVLGPEHTEDTARGIVDFSRRSKIETMQISILTPFPGTELYDEMRSDLIFTDYPVDWDFYDGTHCVYDNSRMGLQRLQEVLLEAHRDFYRWGGLSLRRIRAFLKEEGSLAGKLVRLSANARIARKTLKAWQRENKQFLHTANKKLIGEPVPS